MSIADDLRYRADQARQDADRWRGEIADCERKITDLRRKIEVATLEAIESAVIANIVEQSGLTVEMRDGAPYVHVDKVLVEPPEEQP